MDATGIWDYERITNHCILFIFIINSSKSVCFAPVLYDFVPIELIVIRQYCMYPIQYQSEFTYSLS